LSDGLVERGEPMVGEGDRLRRFIMIAFSCCGEVDRFWGARGGWRDGQPKLRTA
jgi:hypothetical protein